MLEHRRVDEGRAILARFEPDYEYDLDVALIFFACSTFLPSELLG